MKYWIPRLLLCWASLAGFAIAGAAEPVRFAIFGLSHDHAGGFIPRAKDRKDILLVGIIEPREDLVSRYAEGFHLERSFFYPTLDALLAKTNIQAVATFTSTFEHRHVVELCAAKGLHVMMEKPLAVSMEHARTMERAAKRANIELIVNYETTWYPGNQAAYDLLNQEHALGELRKVVVHDGHRGPKEIGCSAAFLDWLTDPKLNGAGALTDFGCYGVDLITWLMNGQKPTSVLAVTQHFKPAVYPKVEDEATILLTYPGAQGILQASWNWPFDRKDMEVYGSTGYVLVPRSDLLRIRKPGTAEKEVVPSALTGRDADPLSYLASVIRRETKPSGLSSLPVNLIVTEILDAAKESARTGKRVELSK